MTSIKEPEQGVIHKLTTGFDSTVEIEGRVYSHPLWSAFITVYVFLLPDGSLFDPEITVLSRDHHSQKASPVDGSLLSNPHEHTIQPLIHDDTLSLSFHQTQAFESPVGIVALIWHSIGHPERIWSFRLREAESAAFCARHLRRKAIWLCGSDWQNTNLTTDDIWFALTQCTKHVFQYLRACLPMPVTQRLYQYRNEVVACENLYAFLFNRGASVNKTKG